MSTTETYANADPITVDGQLNGKADELDGLTKEIDGAVDRVDRAEDAWDEVYDLVEEQLKEEYLELERKSPPSEAAITSATRKQHRAIYTEWRRAKRNLDKIEKKMQAAGKVLSARQTQSNGLRDEMKMGTYAR